MLHVRLWLCLHQHHDTPNLSGSRNMAQGLLPRLLAALAVLVVGAAAAKSHGRPSSVGATVVTLTGAPPERSAAAAASHMPLVHTCGPPFLCRP
jgi:hypothetical protein